MATSTATYTPSPLVKYIGLTVLLIAAVVLTYVSKIFPDTVGLTAIVVYVPSVIYYVSHDLESAGTPNGIPSYTTFAVIVVATGLEGAIGQFVLQNGTVTLAAGLVFAIALLNLIFHTIAEDQERTPLRRPRTGRPAPSASLSVCSRSTTGTPRRGSRRGSRPSSRWSGNTSM